MISVTAIETGKARMKTAQRTGRDGRGAFGRKIDIFRDKAWVDPLPIYAFLIEHPEGRFLVDTGDTWRNSVPGYLPRWNPFFTKEVIIKVAPGEEIGPRLNAMGLDPARDIEAVILTHFHHDHTGGLDHFPHNRIIASRESYEVSRGLKGMLMGCLPQRWPIWLKPELVDLNGPAVGPFPASHPITRDGRIFLVPTPGHAPGHVSVVVRGDGVTYFLAGDATYDDVNLRAEKADGVTNNPDLSVRTLRAIKLFAAGEPTVILPAHDPGVPQRLAAGMTF
ncbi:N-acyl homoserine lactonase family protein [Rhizobiaceae bacterium n13]|uniref:N-acyl homoserine lactonase family protein n=1 Tax=Ferirhizobium litorale TaxID=2927786 RepID=A0AAE3U0H6_9HYPH|nr:N-acyl homoserine lactonase family protein [Fererhizobium litorale]MDI7861224.1 N-acyl homoserine lactonase family protein [Fererhizobium litorale]MDI7921371.1 N-acyl homoserine lactonase family protein [Fererhizobium litorale]